MTHARYTLDELIHDMTDLVATQPDRATLFDRGSPLVERLVRDPESVPARYRRPAGAGRRPGGGSYVLHRGPGLSIVSVVWGPGSHVGPHDHHTWGMIGVMGNAIQETRFRRVDDRDREGHATLEKDRAVLVKPGEVSLLIPDQDEIHQLDNFSDKTTVEIHVYGRDLVGLERCRFDLETGRIATYVLGTYDNC
jgi:predicted metal-dependent enzyme (double-stranded beta helix superfamily)